MTRPIPDGAGELTPREKLELSFQMSAHGIAVMRENLRRANPDLTDDAIEERLFAWLRERPPVELQEGVFRLGTWPRTKRSGDE